MHGTVAAVAGLQRSDLIISLGARFDDRVTGNLDSFAPGALVIHADIDPAEIGKNREVDVPIVGDCREVIADLTTLLRTESAAGQTGDYEQWVDYLADLKKRYPVAYDKPADGSLAPQYVIERLSAIAGPETIYCAGRRPAPDVGGALRRLRAPRHLDQLRRPRHHGLRPAGRDGREGRSSRGHGVGHRRRRLLPDDQPGAGHLRDQRHPDQGRDHQQRVARHGPPVADALLQRALLQHRPRQQADPRLREARRCLRLRGPGLRRPGRRRRDHREGDEHRRPTGRGRLPGAPRRHGVADGRRRAPATTTSSTRATWHPSSTRTTSR